MKRTLYLTILFFENTFFAIYKYKTDAHISDCIKKITDFTQKDKNTLLHLLYTSEETNYGQFDDIKKIINNKDTIEFLHDSIKNRMSKNEIIHFLENQWLTPSDDNDNDDDDDDNDDNDDEEEEYDVNSILIALQMQEIGSRTINANCSHPMYTKHDFDTPIRNSPKEIIPSITHLSEGCGTRAGREAREKFTGVKTLKRKKRQTTT